MATTPTSLVKRLMGTEPCTDGLQVQNMQLVTVAAATTTLTVTPALHAGKVILIQSTGGLVITPPGATGTGNIYFVAFIATISGGSVTWDAKLGNASDVISGVCAAGATIGAGTSGIFNSTTNTNLITWNATTTGGLVGTSMTIIDLATNVWMVEINNCCSSGATAATPFSNH